jgi:hypothetical protein
VNKSLKSAAACALLAPAFAMADTTMDMPARCAGFLTVQLENCSLLNHWRCDSDPADRYRVTTIDHTRTPIREGILAGLSLVEIGPGSGEAPWSFINTDVEDHTTLMQTGRDTYAGTYQHDDLSKGPFVEGESILTGRTVTIDGITLNEVQSTSSFTYPQGGSSQKIVMQYTLDTLEIWIPDRIIDPATGDVTLHFGPTDFIWPGEDGFMSTAPTANCEPLTS